MFINPEHFFQVVIESVVGVVGVVNDVDVIGLTSSSTFAVTVLTSFSSVALGLKRIIFLTHC